MSQREPAAPKCRRRRFAVSVRMLMLLVLVAGATLGRKVNRVQAQKRAVARIRDAGGDVTYDYQFGGDYPPAWMNSPQGKTSPWGPAWLRKLIGDEYFQEITMVSFRGDKVTDDGLAAVEDLDRLIWFDISGTKNVTDAGLTHLRRLMSLRIAWVSAPTITDAGLAHLANLTELRELSLMYMSTTDDGLEQIKGNVRLEILRLHDALNVTDAGLVWIKGLKNLRTLDLRGALNVTDAGLVWIKGLKNLRTLDLSGTMVTDAGLAHLENLTELQVLDLSMDEVSDAGLTHLRGLRRLRELRMIGTSLSDAAVAALTAAIPNLVVSHHPPDARSWVPPNARIRSWRLGKNSKN